MSPLPEKKHRFFLTASCFFALLSLLSHIVYDRGLDYDGSFKLYQMIKDSSFCYYEISRQTFQFLTQLPAWLFLNGSSSDSLFILTKLFSFGFNWIHVFSLLGCYLILPKGKKIFFIFPLFAFFTGPLTALGISVSVALSVCSYVWFSAFVIHYSDLSLIRHKILFIIAPIPLFLSHELMSYMAWPLIGLCVLKYKKESSVFNRYLIQLCVSFFLFVSFFYFIDFLMLENGRKINFFYFKGSVIGFEFLFKDSRLNNFVALSLILKASFFIELFAGKNKKVYQFFSFVLLLFFFLLPLLPFAFYSSLFYNDAHYTRVWPPVFSLPVCLLFWFIYERKSNPPPSSVFSNLFLISCLIGFISLTVYCIQSNRRFFDYQQVFSKQLERCNGVLKSSSVKWFFRGWDRDMDDVWNITAVSILYPQKRDIKSILINDSWLTRCLIKEEECKKKLDMFNLRFPDNLFNSEYQLEQRFFNFKPLYHNFSKSLSYCSLPPKKE